MARCARSAAILAWLLAGVATGCRREEIQVYRVEKEAAPREAATDPHAALSGMSATPKLGFKLPVGWTEQAPSSMRVASFTVGGAEGQAADVAVIPLPGVAGRDLDMVNMWRSQVGLVNIEAAEMSRLVQKVAVGGAEGRLFDMAGTTPPAGEKSALRVLVAMLEREGTAWFFKMTGPDALVQAQRGAFLEFIQSVAFRAVDTATAGSSPGALPAAPTAGAAASERQPTWAVPAGWQEGEAGQFLVAKFTIAGEGGTQAAVNVSMSPGEGGGLISNVNRWRNQLGLSDLSPDEVLKAVTTVEVPGGKAMFVELAGTDARTRQAARLVGAMVPQSSQAWFYKLMGDPKVVEGQKAAFETFVQSAKY